MEVEEAAGVEEEALTEEEAVVAVEAAGEADSLVEARTEAVEVDGVVVAEGVSTGEHSKYLSSRNPLFSISVCECAIVRVYGI